MKKEMNLSYLFTPLYLKELFNGKIDKFKECFVYFNCQNQNKITVADLYNLSYHNLLKNYRNEYIFKNTIAQKILIGKYSLKTSTLFSELRICNSKADIAIFNGTSHVYEIKTELDNFDKLIKQLNDYKKVFEYINVVTVETKLQYLKKILQNLDKKFCESIGILLLTNKQTLSIVQKAQSNMDNIDTFYLFGLLRKIEYLQIIKKYFKSIPRVPNTQIYETCKDMFITLPKEVAHKEIVKTIKQRKKLCNLAENINKIPDSIKIAVIDKNLNLLQQKELLVTLNKNIV